MRRGIKVNIIINTKLKLLNDSITKGISSRNTTSKLPVWCLALALPVLSASAMAAQEQQADAKETETKQQIEKQQEDNKAETEVISVEGFRNVLKESIAVKKFETAIVDAISTEDIGNLPATSLSDVLATITGAGVTRAKGGGTEISLRGLGPKLSATRFNGRDATNGTGNRTVNFSQFPSELVNSIKIYKSQRADLVEGGIAGVIEIGSVRPLDYGKQRIQAEITGSYSPGADDMDNADPYGSKATISYVDQFNLGAMGDFGLTVGLQRYEVSNPQDRMNGSSGWSACDSTVTPELDREHRYKRCTQDADIRPDQDNREQPFYLVPNSYGIVQQGEEDERNAIFSAMQWIPTNDLQFNLDLQYSERAYNEDRHQLYFEDMRRVSPDFDVNEAGVLQSFSGSSPVSTQDRYFMREEEYQGAGFETTWYATDRLSLTTDISHSRTIRSDFDRRSRLRVGQKDIYGNDTPVKEAFPEFSYVMPFAYEHVGDVPSFYLDPSIVDINDHSIFTGAQYLLQDSSVNEHEINAFTLDGSYDIDGDFFTEINAGIRIAQTTYDQKRFREKTTGEKDLEVLRRVNEACRQDFPQGDFLDGASGAEITSWATFDTLCLYREHTGAETLASSGDLHSPAHVDVDEDTAAAYVMAQFVTEIAGLPLAGNFGVRFVKTKNYALGLRDEYIVVEKGDEGNIELEPTGEYSEVVFEQDHFDVLPSVNLNLALQEDLFLRGAVYRAMSRPDPSKLGSGRDFVTDTTELGFETIEDAIKSVTAKGSPGLEPLRAWNADLSLEWYPNDDTMISGAIYHKIFEGGTIPTVVDETYVIDGEEVIIPVNQDRTTDETSKLTGLEFSASHVFSYLPKPFAGLGVKIGYNYAKNDYETHDIRLGDQEKDGTFYEGIIPSAGMSGFSEQVASGQLFYKIGKLELQGIYKYRSSYHKDFLAGNNQLRIIGDSSVVDARATYRVNKHIRVTLQGRNLTNEPVVHDMPVVGSQRDYQSYGPSYYLGVRVNF